ncbi:MAG TPA: hypothetical protein VMT18_12235 [Planctomycetota bacterium]|nr:hypothetical protein [Planctomycetota bacterium]
MAHDIPLLLALWIAPVAGTPGAGPQQIVDTRSASSDLGLPTYGASSSGSVNFVQRGRTDVGGGQMLDWFIIYIGSSVTGSGFDEQFIVFSPNVAQGAARPLVVAYHGYGNTQKDITYKTTLVNECAQRGWYLMAPLSASGAHFMCDPGQKNTGVAMDWMMANLSVDRSRIYGVGFSMGGGMALNFAARHLDPRRWTFAAIVDHTGTVDLIDTYENDPASAFVFDFWYGQGAPGTANYDLMRRASLIEWDYAALQVDPYTDLARNLTHVPLKLIRGTNDPLVGLMAQHDRLNQHLIDLGHVPGPKYSYELIPTNEHSWKTLDEGVACDWLSQWSLDLPSEQRTIAASGGYYYDYLVMQTVGMKLTPFTWALDPVDNEFRLSETANMAQIVVFADRAGLDTAQPLSVVMSTADGKMNKVLVTDYATKPAFVSRDGIVLPSNAWSYGASGKVVILTEWDGTQVHTYSIQP